MAVRGKSSSARTTRWDVLVTNLKPSLPDMPHVVDDLKNLEALLAQARALEAQQEDERGQASKTSGQLKEILRQGDHIRARLGSTLKGKLGFTDETLGKYGFKARSTARKRKGGTPEPPVQSGAQGTPGPATPGTNHTVPTTGAK